MIKFYAFFGYFFFVLGAHAQDFLTSETMSPALLHGPYKIKKHVDGDTFWVENGSEKGLKIRLSGIDAPESRKVFNTPAEPLGKEASKHLANMMPDSLVMLEFDVDSLDRFGRTLAYIFRLDGTFINAKMIADGYATMATFPPNVKYVELYRKLEEQARNQNRGLWNPSVVAE